MGSSPISERQGQARVFFALWPPADIANKLAVLAERHAASAGGRATRCETIHLTLAFIGDVELERLPALQQVAATVHAGTFDLMLDRLGIWRHNRIFWAGCEVPPALTDLAASLRAALQAAGFKLVDGDRDFRPHVTLVRKVAALDAVLPECEPLAWRCEKFVLVGSSLAASGSIYRTLAEFPLGQG